MLQIFSGVTDQKDKDKSKPRQCTSSCLPPLTQRVQRIAHTIKYNHKCAIVEINHELEGKVMFSLF